MKRAALTIEDVTLDTNEFSNKFVRSSIGKYLPRIYQGCKMNRDRWATGENGYLAISVELFNDARQHYPDDAVEMERTYKTATRQKRYLLNELRAIAKNNPDYQRLRDEMIDFIDRVQETTNLLFRPFENVRREMSVEKRDTLTSAENKLTIDITDQLYRAFDVLAVLEPNMDSKELFEKHGFTWEDVSISMALVTGRRMAEIHKTAEFEVIADETHRIKFKGQVKAGRKNSSERWNVIPVLIPSDLVIAGLSFLEYNNKRLGEDRDTSHVNARFSTALSKSLKGSVWDFYTVSDGYDEAIHEAFTYHKLRAAYAQAALKSDKPNVDADHGLEYIRDYLGDSTDEAAKFYRRFRLHPDSAYRLEYAED